MNREQKQYTEAIASHLQNIQIYASNMPPGIMQPILTDVVALQQAYHDHLDELTATQSYLLGRILSQAQKTEQYYDIRTEVAAIRDSFSALQKTLQSTKEGQWLQLIQEMEQDSLKLSPALCHSIHQYLEELKTVPNPDRFKNCVNQINKLTRGDFYQVSFEVKLERLGLLYQSSFAAEKESESAKGEQIQEIEEPER